jgi:hypothetical protein
LVSEWESVLESALVSLSVSVWESALRWEWE